MRIFKSKKISPELVVIVCAAGNSNFGDDIIGRYWAKFYDPIPVIFISGENGDFIENQPNVITRYSFRDTQEIIDNLGPTMPSKVLWHIGGGGYLNDLFSTVNPLETVVSSLKNKSPLIGTGLSFYPLNESRELLRKKIKFNFLSVRDRSSFWAFWSKNPLKRKLYGDDSYLIPLKELVFNVDGRKLNICIQCQFEAEGALETIGGLISEYSIKNHFEGIRVFQFSIGDEKIIPFLKNTKIELIERSFLLKNGLPLSKEDAFISTRFHMRLICERFGLPGLGISVNDYYVNKHEIGLKSFLFQGPAVTLDKFCTEGVPLLTRNKNGGDRVRSLEHRSQKCLQAVLGIVER